MTVVDLAESDYQVAMPVRPGLVAAWKDNNDEPKPVPQSESTPKTRHLAARGPASKKGRGRQFPSLSREPKEVRQQIWSTPHYLRNPVPETSTENTTKKKRRRRKRRNKIPTELHLSAAEKRKHLNTILFGTIEAARIEAKNMVELEQDNRINA